MQTYSSLKGKSKSDDGIAVIAEHTVLERQTFSDDGFDSFPEYNRPETPDSETESTSSHSKYESASFHSCASELWSFEDTMSQACTAGETQDSPSDTRSPSVPNPQDKKKKKKVKKRRRPKKKNGSPTENDAQTQDVPGRDGPGAGSQELAGVQSRSGKSAAKGVAGEEVQLSAEELMGAMELLRLWKESLVADREVAGRSRAYGL